MPPSSFDNENSHSSNRNNPHNKYDNDNNDAVIDRENYSSHHHHHEQQLTTTKRPVPDPVIHFEIQIHSGDNLAAKDRNLLGRRTTSDPYVELYLEESKMWKTKTIPKTLCPVWNHEIFTIKVSIESLLTTHCGTRPRSKKNHPYFELRIFDEDDYSKNDHMGTIRIPVPISKNDLTNIRNGNYPCYNSDDDDTSSSHHSDTIDDNDHHPNMSMSDFRNKWFPVPPESAKNAKGKIKVSMKTFINGKTREEMKKVFVAQNKKGQSSKAKKPEKRLSILVLGAAGRTGLECIKKMSRHLEGPLVHAFTRENGTPLLDVDKERCASVFEGDATNEDDIKAAIKQSRAKIIVVCIGDNSSSSSRSTKRRSSLGTSSTSSTNGRRRGRSSSTPPKDSDATIKATTTKTTTTNNVRTECAQAIVNVLTPIVHKKKDSSTCIIKSRRGLSQNKK